MRLARVLHCPHMTAKGTTLEEIGEMLTHVVEHMATKEDVTEVKIEIAAVESRLTKRIVDLGEQVGGIERELREIRRDLEALREKFENVEEYRKEIDHAFERIAVIEKHLGIDRKVTAQ